MTTTTRDFAEANKARGQTRAGAPPPTGEFAALRDGNAKNEKAEQRQKAACAARIFSVKAVSLAARADGGRFVHA